MTRISEFLKVAEVSGATPKSSRADVNVWRSNRHEGPLVLQQVGIDRGDIPDLSQVSQNTDAMENRWAFPLSQPHLICFCFADGTELIILDLIDIPYTTSVYMQVSLLLQYSEMKHILFLVFRNCYNNGKKVCWFLILY